MKKLTLSQIDQLIQQEGKTLESMFNHNQRKHYKSGAVEHIFDEKDGEAIEKHLTGCGFKKSDVTEYCQLTIKRYQNNVLLCITSHLGGLIRVVFKMKNGYVWRMKSE